MIMFFDCETTGKPRNYKAAMDDVENWPRVIQLAWQATNASGDVFAQGDYLIKPDGWLIPKETFWLEHGFDTDKSLQEGQPLADVLTQFVTDLQQCDFLVAHNLAFDHNVVGAEMIRLGMKSAKRPMKICTMEASVNVCRIPFPGQRNWPGRRGAMTFKWPKLEELHRHLFGKDFENAHDASGDVTALRLCFFELCKRQVITLTPDGVSIQ